MDKDKIPMQVLADSRQSCEEVTKFAVYILHKNNYTKTFTMYNPYIRKQNKVNYNYPEMGFIFKYSNN